MIRTGWESRECEFLSYEKERHEFQRSARQDDFGIQQSHKFHRSASGLIYEYNKATNESFLN